MLQMVSTQIYGAQRSLQELRKTGHKTGNLKFVQYSKYDTFVYNQSGYHIRDGSLHLSKIGNIKMVQHRGIPQNSTIKQISITRKANRWFANIVLNIDGLLPTISQKLVGIDLGITNFAYDSDGCSIPNPLNYANLLKPLKRVQRKVSRRRKGSQNRKKAILWYRRIHQKIQNKRRDFLHKLSTQYAKRYGMIFLERLQKLTWYRTTG